MIMAGIEELGIYILRSQNKLSQYIANRPILYLCLEAYKRPGDQVYTRWWEQVGMVIFGTRAVVMGEAYG